MTSADSLFTSALHFHGIGDLEAARFHYLAALRDNPNHVQSLMNLSDILSRKNQIAAAAVIMSKAVELNPKLGTLWSNYGNALTRLERYADARVALVNAVTLAPENSAGWHNLILLALREGNFEEAISTYESLVALGGDNEAVKNDVAHAYLMIGDLPKALKLYEVRWHILSHLDPWDLRVKEWEGESLVDKRILVHSEQGFGDTIMVSRFVKELAASGARVTFATEPATVRLFEAQEWPNVEVCNIFDTSQRDPKEFDFHSPLYSMMRHLGVTKEKICGTPYLSAPPLTVPSVYRSALNVGICWFSGRRNNQLDWRRRVSPLELWLPLAEVPGVQLWSLCPGEDAQNEIVKLGAESVVLDEVTSFESFAETAAFIDKLDLVVSVDTAVAHLAAAMGKPTWMLSQFTPCWRWWDRVAGTGRPWYDCMSVLLQHQPGDWKSQLEECKLRLSQRQNVRVERAA